MFLFAEATGGVSANFIIFMLIMGLGMRQWGIWIRGNPALRRGGVKVASHFLSRLLK